jgi:hypothetical protein
MKIKVIQNALRNETATIRITSTDLNWEAAYNNWIVGKDPTFSAEWRKGIIFFYEEEVKAEPKSLWQTDYWCEGGEIYDFFMKKYTCSKCKGGRTAALCRGCIAAASKKEAERNTEVIDVLASSALSAVDPPKDIELSPDMLRALSDSYGAFGSFFSKLDKFFDLLREVSRKHGGSLHLSAGCPDCLQDKLTWLNTNHSDWREKTSERGCCSVCIVRGYDILKNGKEVKETKKKETKKAEEAPKAIAL